MHSGSSECSLFSRFLLVPIQHLPQTHRIENCRLRPWQWWGLTSWSAGRESPIALSIPGDDVIASSPCGCLSPSCVNQPAQPRAWQQACRERAEQATHPDHGSLDIEQLPGVDLRRRVRRLALSALISPSHARPAERKHQPSVRAPRSMLAGLDGRGGYRLRTRCWAHVPA